MRKLFIVSFTLFALYLNATEVNSQLSLAYRLLRSDLDSATIVAKDILQQSVKEGDLHGEVQANFILGYITKAQENYGVSVIYYLEAIRKADEADYETVDKDRISLRKNLANTFSSFKAFDLAIDYYLQALRISEEINHINQILAIKLKLGDAYTEVKEYSSAIQMYEDVIAIASDDNIKLNAINSLGSCYIDKEDYELAEVQFQRIFKSPSGTNLYAMALHNMGEVAFEKNDIQQSINYLRESISINENLSEPNLQNRFRSYRNLGTYLYYDNNVIEAEEYLLKASELIEHDKNDPRSFETFKTLSTLYYSMDNKAKGEFYQNEYFRVSQEYIALQQEIQKRDKEYNFSLITKRYFDDVKKQDRLASVIELSKFSTGSLLLIVGLVIFYFRNEKKRLRKSIEKELNALEVF